MSVSDPPSNGSGVAADIEKIQVEYRGEGTPEGVPLPFAL